MKFLKYILLLLVGQTIAQTTVTTESALNKHTKINGIVVVEFWAKWNDKNACSFLKDLEDCNTVRADIEFHLATLPKPFLFSCCSRRQSPFS